MFSDEIKSVLKKVYLDLDILSDVTLSLSNKPELCDYQCNDVFKIAKDMGKSPIEVGELLVNKINELSEFSNYFKEVVFAKPGFINFKLSDKFINKYLVLLNGDIKNGMEMPQSLKMVIDYGGPNVAKPLHVGHMRTAIVGESVKRVMKFFGHDVISDVHLGDIGLQIGQVIYKVLEDSKSFDDINIDYLNVTYPYMSKLCKEDEFIKEKCALITKELQDGDIEYRKYFKKICEVSVADIKKNYDFLGVSFDYWYGESDAYNYLDDTTKILSDILVESQGAKVIDVKLDTDKIDMPPLLYQKSNGAYLYAFSDLATIYQRKLDFNPDKILYVTDLRQALHFTQVFRAADKSGLFKIDNLEHLGYGTVNGSDNKPFKTRSGETPKLEDLFNDAKNIFVSKKESNKDLSDIDLNKIVNSILKFADLQNSRDKDYIFDLNKFSEVNGKTGPYILYTYLRVNKMIKEFSKDIKLSSNIYNEYDRNLRLKVLEVNKNLEFAYNERKPSYIAEYLYSLCSEVNVFYQNNYLNNESDLVKVNDWVFVLNLVNKIIVELLDLLVIEVPSEM